MSSNVSDAAPDRAAEGTEASPVTEAPRDLAKARLWHARALVALAGLLAALTSFGIGEAVYKIIPAKLVPQRAPMTNREVMVPSLETQVVASSRNAALAFGALGLCLGGLMGIAGGLARRSTFSAAMGGLLGVVLGSALGAGASLGLVPLCLKEQFARAESDLLIALIMHGFIWGLLGASAGLAFAAGLGERRFLVYGITAGLLGALMGAITFDMIGAVFLDNARTIQPISETWQSRFLARLVVAIGAAAALALFLPEPRRAK